MFNLSLPATAWAITEPGLANMLSAYKQAQSGISITLEDFFTPRAQLEITNGIAHIHIKGALLDKAPAIHDKLEGTDYRSIRAEIAQAVSSGAKGFLFMMDSPGGTVAGLAEVAAMIAELDQPTIAYCDGMCCSAAYYLAAGCDYIVASPSATIGNIGTVMSWMDFSAAYERMGIKTETITNSGADLKGTFRENPMRESQRAFLQAQADQMGAEFQIHVSNSRSVDPEVFRAGWYHGQAALDLGLCDALGSLTDTLLELQHGIELKSQTM